MNEAFPESALYLFDTFEGFDERDIETDQQYDLSQTGSAALNEKLKDTSVQIVLDKMPFPERCIVKKGYFPDTTENARGHPFRVCFHRRGPVYADSERLGIFLPPHGAHGNDSCA